MKAWTEWETIRTQVAICGRVVDEHDQPVAGADVVITAMPEEFRRRVAGMGGTTGGGWDRSDHTWDVTRAEADGIYYFLDLPAGTYTVKGRDDRRPGVEAEQTVSVSRSPDGTVKMAVADLKLSDTRRGK